MMKICLSSFEMRLCLIIKNHDRWIAPAKVSANLTKSYFDGYSTARYDYKYVCEKLRWLAAGGVLERGGKRGPVYKLTPLGNKIIQILQGNESHTTPTIKESKGE